VDLFFFSFWGLIPTGGYTFFLWDLEPVDVFFFPLFGDIVFHPDFGLPTYPKAEKD